jgi:hypothetical protein
MGLALVLLIGSGLMIRTFRALRSIQPGFTYPEQVQLLRISIPETQVKSAVCEIFCSLATEDYVSAGPVYHLFLSSIHSRYGRIVSAESIGVQ